MYSYPLWLLVFVVLPIIIIWVFKHKLLINYYKVIILAIIGSAIFSLSWDYIAIQERIWFFEKPYIFGVWFLGLPIEEWAFIILVTLLFGSITIVVWDKYGIKS